MKALLIDIKASGIVSLDTIDFHLFENIKDFSDIELRLHKAFKSIKDYKYHIFEDDDFVPAIFRVQDGFFNQMQEFYFERVTFRELPIDDKAKEALIKKLITDKRATQKKQLITDNIENLFYATVDETKEAEIVSLVEKLEELKGEINYEDYLDELV